MNDPVSRLSRGGSINKSLRNYLSKRWFEFCFLLHEKMVYYSGEELMLLRDSKYIIRRDTDKFREFLRKMESPLFLFDKAMERFLAIKEKLLLVTDRQDIIGSGEIF